MEDPAHARKVFIEVDFVIIGLVISVHRADLGQATEKLWLIRKLEENFIWFSSRRASSDLSERAARTVFAEVLPPLFERVFWKIFGMER